VEVDPPWVRTPLSLVKKSHIDANIID